MKKANVIRLLLALVLALGLAVMPALALADVGNFAGDTDWGDDWGSSDWGSSDWGSSSDWDSDDDFLGGFLLGSAFNGMPTWMILAILVIYLVIRSNKKRKQGTGQPVPPPPPVRNAEALLAALKARDPQFSQEAFLERVRNSYVQMQDAWEAKKWEPIRAIMSDALFNQTKRQLDEYIQKGQTNHVDRVAVLSAVIQDVQEDESHDILVVRLNARLVDYVTDDANGALIRGDKNRELFMTYDWTMMRSKSAVTEHTEGEHASHCPSCGAPISLNQSGQCEYCGTVLTSGTYDWILTDIRGISQRS